MMTESLRLKEWTRTLHESAFGERVLELTARQDPAPPRPSPFSSCFHVWLPGMQNPLLWMLTPTLLPESASISLGAALELHARLSSRLAASFGACVTTTAAAGTTGLMRDELVVRVARGPSMRSIMVMGQSEAECVPWIPPSAQIRGTLTLTPRAAAPEEPSIMRIAEHAAFRVAFGEERLDGVTMGLDEEGCLRLRPWSLASASGGKDKEQRGLQAGVQAGEANRIIFPITLRSGYGDPDAGGYPVRIDGVGRSVGGDGRDSLVYEVLRADRSLILRAAPLSMQDPAIRA